MNQLTELLMYRALHFKQSSDNTTDSVLEHFVASNELAPVSYTHLTLPTSDLV